MQTDWIMTALMNVSCIWPLEGDFLQEDTRGGEINSSRTRVNKRDVKEEERGVTGVLNPTTCLELGDVILFTVDEGHYPLYDLWVSAEAPHVHLVCYESALCFLHSPSILTPAVFQGQPVQHQQWLWLGCVQAAEGGADSVLDSSQLLLSGL